MPDATPSSIRSRSRCSAFGSRTTGTAHNRPRHISTTPHDTTRKRRKSGTYSKGSSSLRAAESFCPLLFGKPTIGSYIAEVLAALFGTTKEHGYAGTQKGTGYGTGRTGNQAASSTERRSRSNICGKVRKHFSRSSGQIRPRAAGTVECSIEQSGTFGFTKLLVTKIRIVFDSVAHDFIATFTADALIFCRAVSEKRTQVLCILTEAGPKNIAKGITSGVFNFTGTLIEPSSGLFHDRGYGFLYFDGLPFGYIRYDILLKVGKNLTLPFYASVTHGIERCTECFVTVQGIDSQAVQFTGTTGGTFLTIGALHTDTLPVRKHFFTAKSFGLCSGCTLFCRFDTGISAHQIICALHKPDEFLPSIRHINETKRLKSRDIDRHWLLQCYGVDELEKLVIVHIGNCDCGCRWLHGTRSGKSFFYKRRPCLILGRNNFELGSKFVFDINTLLGHSYLPRYCKASL